MNDDSISVPEFETKYRISLGMVDSIEGDVAQWFVKEYKEPTYYVLRDDVIRSINALYLRQTMPIDMSSSRGKDSIKILAHYVDALKECIKELHTKEIYDD